MACILGKTTQIVRIHLMSHSINDLGAGRLYPMTVCSSSKMCINEVQKFFSSFEYKVIHIEARIFIKLDTNLYLTEFFNLGILNKSSKLSITLLTAASDK